MTNIDNIIFDFGGVFLDLDYNRTRTAFEKLGVINFDKMYSQADAGKLFQKLETGHIPEEDFYPELNRCTGLSLSPEQIDDAWNAMLLQYRESSLQYLEVLKEKYKLYLFSNTNYIHMAAFKKIFEGSHPGKHFDDYFAKAYYSCRMGLRKPDEKSFEWILDDLGIEAQKTLFIDDTYQNIEAAERVGIKAIHLKPGMRIEELDL